MKGYGKKKSAARPAENGSFWLSFSDMMSVLVLIFIFVVFSMLYTLNESETKYKTAQEEYAIALARAESSEQEQQNLVVLLGEAQDKLSDAQAEAERLEDEKQQLVLVIDDTSAKLTEAQTSLSDTQAELTVISSQLTESKTALASLASKNQELSSENEDLSASYALLLQDKQMLEANSAVLDEQIAALETEIAEKRAQYASLVEAADSNALLIAQYQSDISSYKQQLSDTQTQLEAMLGVKTQIVQRLSEELSANNISVQVDTQTGAITLPGAALFDSGATYLKDSGKEYLDSFLPVYLSVLFSDEFRPYIAEIVIEGHTDSTGKSGADAYLYNLELSQQRALAVADYILDNSYMTKVLGLSRADASSFRQIVTASGRSFSSLIYNADGSENKEASRRVEIKFNLKDDATIEATKQLLELIGTDHS